MAKQFKPLGDRVIVEPIEREEMTAGGIYVPETAKEKPHEGKVVAVGPGRILDNGERVPLDVSEGDRVLFAKYAGTEFTLNGNQPVLILNQRDILAIVE